MAKCILTFLVLSFGLNSLLAQKEKVEFPYAAYYMNLNNALAAADKKNETARDSFLWLAYKAYPKQNRTFMPEWYMKLLINSIKDQKELSRFLNKQNIVVYDSAAFVNSYKGKWKKEVNENAHFESAQNYFHPQAAGLDKSMDTLQAIDLYAMGSKQSIDTNMVQDKYKLDKNDVYGSRINSINYLSSLFENYGLLGEGSCSKCIIIGLYIPQINNPELFMQMDKNLKQLLILGYLSPNIYAWAYDMAYFNKYGKPYYYFSLNYPNRGQLIDFKKAQDLSPAEQKEVNQRRNLIGIPNLPYSFHLLTEIEF